MDAPGAALKQAMTDAGIGQDLLGGYENGILQPYFSVIAKNANKEQFGEFLAVVKGTLRKLADQGIDRNASRRYQLLRVPLPGGRLRRRAERD